MIAFEYLDLEIPTGVQLSVVSDISVDDAGRIYLLARSPVPIIAVFDAAGTYVAHWTPDCFVNPHGVTVGPGGIVYVADSGAHAVWILDPSGAVTGHWGDPGNPSNTGVDWSRPTVRERYSTVSRGAEPFNRPTKVAVGPDGTFHVADGYGNARVHHFDADGSLVGSWGEPGSSDGGFRLPHAVLVLPDGSILVADRENDRVQRLNAEGICQAVWALQRPAALCAVDDHIVVTELGWSAGEYSFSRGPVSTDLPARISVLDESGVVVDRATDTPDGFLSAPHGVGSSPNGRAYVAQLTSNFGPDAARLLTLTLQ